MSKKILRMYQVFDVGGKLIGLLDLESCKVFDLKSRPRYEYKNGKLFSIKSQSVYSIRSDGRIFDLNEKQKGTIQDYSGFLKAVSSNENRKENKLNNGDKRNDLLPIKNQNTKFKRTMIILCIAIVLIPVVFILINLRLNKPQGAIDSANSENTGYSTPTSSEPLHSVEYPNVKEYFEEKSDIKAIIPVNDDDLVFTEQEVINELKARGFNDYSITTEYSISGAYSEAVEVSLTSTVKHPMYQTYYVNSSGEIWTIIIIGNTVVATPLSYYIQYPNAVPITISENSELLSYDSSTNSYYRTIPKDTVMDVRVVDKITAKILDTLTIGELCNG